MPLFRYRGRTGEGTVVEGTVEAVHEQAARSALLESQMRPEEIYEIPAPFPISPGSIASWNIDGGGSVTAASSEHLPMQETAPDRKYLPLLDTLRLYAGWLLAWYFLIYALGSYQYLRRLPFRIPFVEELFLSPIILHFSFLAFLFLLFSGFQKRLRGGIASGGMLLVIGIGIYLVFRENV